MCSEKNLIFDYKEALKGSFLSNLEFFFKIRQKRVEKKIGAVILFLVRITYLMLKRGTKHQKKLLISLLL